MTLAVANTIQVYRITKAQKGSPASFSDTGVEFPRVSLMLSLVHAESDAC